MPRDNNAARKPKASSQEQNLTDSHHDASAGTASLRDITEGTADDPDPEHLSHDDPTAAGNAEQVGSRPSDPSDHSTKPNNTTPSDPQTAPSDEQIRALLEGDPEQWRQAVHWLAHRHRNTGQPRRCYYILQSSFDPEHGYIPIVITENEAGYSPMTGQGTAAAPWYWGRDLATARRICDDANAGLGHTAADVREIVLSCLAAQRN